MKAYVVLLQEAADSEYIYTENHTCNDVKAPQRLTIGTIILFRSSDIIFSRIFSAISEWLFADPPNNS